MDTIFEAIIITALTVLYGLAWHNQPAHGVNSSSKRPNPSQQTS